MRRFILTEVMKSEKPFCHYLDLGNRQRQGGFSRRCSPRSRDFAMFRSETRIWSFIAVVSVLALISVMRKEFLFPYASLFELTIQERINHILPNDDISNWLPQVRAGSEKTSSSSSIMVAEYPVCLLLTIGDDIPRPNNEALPFQSLYRLFDAAKAELMPFLMEMNNGLHHWSGFVIRLKLLVVVDYVSVACKMARDSVRDAQDMDKLKGVALECLTAKELFSSRNGTRVSCHKALVGQSARHVNQLTPEMTQKIKWGKLHAINLDESDPYHNPPSITREEWRPTIVTAFSSNHFTLALLLLRSIGKAGREAAAAGNYNISIVVYTLEDFNSTLRGILDCLVFELNEDYHIPTEVRRFDFLKYPLWMRINQTKGYDGGRGEYAWKAVIVHSVLIERGFVLWADAGCRFEYNSLVETLTYTRDHGFANRDTSGVVPDFVHAGMLSYLRYAVDFDRRVVNCDASTIGFTLDKYTQLVRPWYDCSITRQCIAPDGSNRENHRQDQAALTLLADMTSNACVGVSDGVMRHMDYNDLDTSGTSPTRCYQDPLTLTVDWAS